MPSFDREGTPPSNRLNTAIIGGGRACEAILNMARGDVMQRFGLRVVAVADADERKPGMRFAQKLGIRTTTDFHELYQLPDLEVIIELTGDQAIREDLEKHRPRHIALIDHVGARLFWELNQAEAAIIHQRTRMREEVDAERAYLQSILDNAPLTVITTDLNGDVVAFNPSGEATLGYRSWEMVGKPASMLYREPRERARLLRRVKQEGAVRDYETVLVRKDGSKVPVSITLAQLRDTSGEMIGTVGMSRDISHRKALMNQIIQSERLAAVGRLAAGVAHEINNPLAVIGEVAGYLHDLVDEPGEIDTAMLVDELREWLPKLSDQVKRGRSVTHRMLRFSRKSEADVEVVDTNKALDEIVPFLDKEAKLANVTIHRNYQADLPRVQVEEMQLQEIFLNLITNAVQAIRDQGGGGDVWLTTKTQRGKVAAIVKDNGPGIDQEVRDRLFDPFVSTKPTGQGTGLGLSICYGIVKRYDGEIRVQSKPGEGATFTVLFRAWKDPKGG